MVDNKDYLYALNVALPDYFEKVQHYLDCAAYDQEYQFPSLFEKENIFKVTAKKCLDTFDEEATTLSPDCNNMCQKLDIANFSPVFESNHTFVVKAVNYYETLAHNAIEKVEKKQKDEFNEMAKITKEADQEVSGVGATNTAKKTEKERLLREEKERLAEIERRRLARIAAEKRRREAAAAAARRRAAAAAAARRKKKKPWWKFWRQLVQKKDKTKFSKLIKGKSKKKGISIAKKLIAKEKKARKLKNKRKSYKKLSRKLILKHFPKHRKIKKRYRNIRILEAKPAEAAKKAEGDAKKPADAGVPKPPPKGAPKDPVHQALLKKMKGIYEEIEFMFDKNAPGVVKTADLPLDIDSFSKTFLYGQGINVYLYAQMINIEISKTDLLALLNGKKMGDAMENRIRQILDIINDEFKLAFNADMEASFIFNLGAEDTHITEKAFEKTKEHFMPVECFSDGCEDTPTPTAAVDAKTPDAPAEGEKKKEEPKKDEAKKDEAKKDEAKKEEPKKSSQTRILQMDKGFDELEGLFDLREGSKKKQILF